MCNDASVQMVIMGDFCYVVFQIPARTSSAPPNLDEQKRDQVLSSFMFSR